MSVIGKHKEEIGVSLKSTTEEYIHRINSEEHCSTVKGDLQKHEEAISLGLKLSAQIFQRAQELNIPILVDAELKDQYYTMYAVTLAGAAMLNKKSNQTMIYGTYQCYFRDILSYVEECMSICRDLNIRFGAKFVRGAYLQREREIAQELGIPDPTWSSYEETSDNYNSMIQYTLGKKSENEDSVGVFVASHNKESIEKAIRLIQNLNLNPGDENINFGQIYGMCDPISFCLGKAGFNVYKSVPWGHPDELVAYLGRRASENYTAFQTARNELPIYKNELKRRFSLRN